MKLDAQLVQWITSLNRNKYKGRPRPHKPVLLLAVLELAESGKLLQNEVHFAPPLFEYFARYWEALTDEPVGKIQYPFWHMDTEPFWSLVGRAGHEARLSEGKRYSPSAKQIREWISHARLEDRLFQALQDGPSRTVIRHLILGDAFADRLAKVEQLRHFEAEVYQYTEVIWQVAEQALPYAAEIPAEPVRSTAFRRLVLEAYDYSCAVSRVRLSFPRRGYELVQAAHIHEWADSHDDQPQNGLALTPDYHWLFDRGLFTIDQDYRILVSKAAAECSGSVKILLLSLRGKRIQLPRLERQWPDARYLTWHNEQKFIHA